MHTVNIKESGSLIYLGNLYTSDEMKKFSNSIDVSALESRIDSVETTLGTNSGTSDSSGSSGTTLLDRVQALEAASGSSSGSGGSCAVDCQALADKVSELETSLGTTGTSNKSLLDRINELENTIGIADSGTSSADHTLIDKINALLNVVGVHFNPETQAWQAEPGTVATPIIATPGSNQTTFNLNTFSNGSVYVNPDFVWTPYLSQYEDDIGILTQFQIATDSRFTNCIVDTGETADYCTSYTLPDYTLTAETKYYARVRHHGSILGWSDWSATRTFTAKSGNAAENSNLTLTYDTHVYNGDANEIMELPEWSELKNAVIVNGTYGTCSIEQTGNVSITIPQSATANQKFTITTPRVDNHRTVFIVFTQADNIRGRILRLNLYPAVILEPDIYKIVADPENTGKTNFYFRPMIIQHGIDQAAKLYLQIANDSAFTDKICDLVLPRTDDDCYSVPATFQVGQTYWYRAVWEGIRYGRGAYSTPRTFTMQAPDISVSDRLLDGNDTNEACFVHRYDGRLGGLSKDDLLPRYDSAHETLPSNLILMDNFTTWTVPDGVTQVRVLIIGNGLKTNYSPSIISAIVPVFPFEKIPIMINNDILIGSCCFNYPVSFGFENNGIYILTSAGENRGRTNFFYNGTALADTSLLTASGMNIISLYTGQTNINHPILQQTPAETLYKTCHSFKDMSLDNWQYDARFEAGTDGSTASDGTAGGAGQAGSVHASGYGIGGAGGTGNPGGTGGFGGGIGGAGGIAPINSNIYGAAGGYGLARGGKGGDGGRQVYAVGGNGGDGGLYGGSGGEGGDAEYVAGVGGNAGYGGIAGLNGAYQWNSKTNTYKYKSGQGKSSPGCVCIFW